MFVLNSRNIIRLNQTKAVQPTFAGSFQSVRVLQLLTADVNLVKHFGFARVLNCQKEVTHTVAIEVEHAY